MSWTIPQLPRAARRRLQRMARKSRDAQEVRRALAVLRRSEGYSVTDVSVLLSAARSSIYRWLAWFWEGGVEGLRSRRGGRARSTVSERVVSLLGELLKKSPQALNYLRTRWSSGLLAKELGRQLGVPIHASTIRRLLPRMGYRWRRARPFLFKRDPRKRERLEAIDQALSRRDRREAVFFADEVDIDLNPKIGFGWRKKGHQDVVPTPGTNEKQFLAGALHAHTGSVIWVEGANKRSELFVALLKALRRTYRGFRKLVLIVDNSIIHKSRETRSFLADNPKFVLLFQPTYHPWVNRIERLWKALHETVTLNHRWPSMEALIRAVRRFIEVAQPFPGAGHGVVTLDA
jgi:transposase